MPAIVPTGKLTLIVFLIGAAAFFIAFWFARWTRPAEAAGGTAAGGSRIGLVLQGAALGLTMLGPVRPSLSMSHPLAIAETLIAAGCAAGATWLFVASRRALGANWSLVARTRADHSLTTAGPYGTVRHPIYTALLLLLIGAATATGHWVSFVVTLPLYLWGTRIRTRHEDALLETVFGQTFRDYRRATPGLVPRGRSR
jgi:protein-S-isoprenylcysteine O-methyltransferase Ste14